jgi:hypothetical protein
MKDLENVRGLQVGSTPARGAAAVLEHRERVHQPLPLIHRGFDGNPPGMN